MPLRRLMLAVLFAPCLAIATGCGGTTADVDEAEVQIKGAPAESGPAAVPAPTPSPAAEAAPAPAPAAEPAPK